MQKKHELSILHPDARQCGRCGAGPVMLAGCEDLTTHHGQVMSGPRGAQGDRPPVDNSCGRCAPRRPEPSLHSYCTFPKPSLRPPCALRAQSLRPPCTLPAPSLHPPCTLPAPSLPFQHPPCTPCRHRCGWFAPHISQWPAWDPTAAALGADGQEQASSKLVCDGFALTFLIVVTVTVTPTLTRQPSGMRTPTRPR